MIRSGFFIFALGISVIESSGWYYPSPVSNSWNNFRPSFFFYKQPEQPEQTPLELMVDITNALGVAILQDQSLSKGNFAFSPYGVASVLVVLYEGSQGESAQQIQRAVKFPLDKNLIRIGFRDMHRYLRSYFSHEGYLSGIALNKDVLNLKSDYKSILNFYGYDVNFPENGNQQPNDEIPSGSTAEPLPVSTAAENFLTTNIPTTNVFENKKTGSTYGDIQTETTKKMEELTSNVPDITIDIQDSQEENQVISTEMSTKASEEKQSETEKEITTERNRNNTLQQNEINNLVISNKTLETKETTTLTNIKQDMEDSENELDEENKENNNGEFTTDNENLTNDAMGHEKVTKTEIQTEITTEGIGAALDNGMLIPQLGDFETTIKSLVKDMTSSAAEATTAPTLLPTSTDLKSSTDVTQTTAQIVKETSISELSTLSEIKETSISELSTLSEIKETLAPTSKTTNSMFFTTDISETKTMFISENLSTTAEHTSQYSETEISSISTKSTLTEDEISTTNSAETTEAASELLEHTTIASTLTPNEKLTTTTLTVSFPGKNRKKKVPSSFNEINNLKKKRSISLNSLGKRGFVNVVAESNTTKNEINPPVSYFKNKSYRRKRAILDYLRSSSFDSDLTIQLQNGMPGIYSMRNINFFRSLPRQLFLVNYDVETPVPMITYTNVFLYGYIPKLFSKALEFPLDDIRYKLLILLPVERRGLKELIYNLGNCFLREIIESLRPTKVRVAIPMFMAEGFVILNSSLKKLGIKDVFDANKANLSGMSTDSELYVRNIEQSITVVVRNYVEMFDIQTRTMAARHVVQEFEATYPFVYFVLDTATNVALMAGQILDPLNTRIY